MLSRVEHDKSFITSGLGKAEDLRIYLAYFRVRAKHGVCMTWPVRLLARKYEISFRYFFSYHILINKIEEMTRYLKRAGPV